MVAREKCSISYKVERLCRQSQFVGKTKRYKCSGWVSLVGGLDRSHSTGHRRSKCVNRVNWTQLSTAIAGSSKIGKTESCRRKERIPGAGSPGLPEKMNASQPCFAGGSLLRHLQPMRIRDNYPSAGFSLFSILAIGLLSRAAPR